MTYSVDYPGRTLNRVSTAFRVVAAIPIALLALLLQSLELPSDPTTLAQVWSLALTGGGVLILPTAAMIIARKKYPLWWYNWNVELLRFTNRIWVYVALMDDRYPSTDDHQAVHLDLPLPDTERLSRGLPAVKWLLATPHYFALAVVYVGVLFAVLGAWLAILITGRYPRALFEYVEGVFRWTNRVIAYAYALVTDQYPPFSLRP